MKVWVLDIIAPKTGEINVFEYQEIRSNNRFLRSYYMIMLFHFDSLIYTCKFWNLFRES